MVLLVASIVGGCGRETGQSLRYASTAAEASTRKVVEARGALRQQPPDLVKADGALADAEHLLGVIPAAVAPGIGFVEAFTWGAIARTPWSPEAAASRPADFVAAALLQAGRAQAEADQARVLHDALGAVGGAVASGITGGQVVGGVSVLSVLLGGAGFLLRNRGQLVDQVGHLRRALSEAIDYGDAAAAAPDDAELERVKTEAARRQDRLGVRDTIRRHRAGKTSPTPPPTAA